MLSRSTVTGLSQAISALNTERGVDRFWEIIIVYLYLSEKHASNEANKKKKKNCKQAIAILHNKSIVQ